MKGCSICQVGTVQPQLFKTLTFEKNKRLVLVRDVPASVCDTCGEAYLEESVAQKVMKVVAEARKRGVELEIITYNDTLLPGYQEQSSLTETH